MTTINLDIVKSAVARMRNDSAATGTTSVEPKEFLASHGVVVDADLERLVLTHRAKGVSASRQAAIVHIDT